MKKMTWLLATVLLLISVLAGCSPAEEAAFEDVVITDAEVTGSAEDPSAEGSCDEDATDPTKTEQEAAEDEADAGNEEDESDLSAGSVEEAAEDAEDLSAGSEEEFSYEEDEGSGEDDGAIITEGYEDTGLTVEEDGTYSSKEEVALYIHTYGKLPSNYITKKEAEKLGWVPSKGNLWDVAPGMSIGGSYFGNYEGILPDNDYRECDIDYAGGRRNAKRIVFSEDGHVYYTEDHYESFEQLY